MSNAIVSGIGWCARSRSLRGRTKAQAHPAATHYMQRNGYGRQKVASDTTGRAVRFMSRDDATEVFALACERPDTGRLILRGRWGSDSVELLLRRHDEARYRLVS